MILDRDACYRALRTRDARFDGRFFIAVRTTGIYCRPICPARTARLENVVFYASAAAAQEAGFRPCLRCRPECSPDLAAWRGTSSTVSRAVALIADGALDGDEADVAALAERVGIGERHLRRLFQTHLGASPVAVAQTKRIHFAKQLLHETTLRMVDVAFAAGFGSVRRFNETFRRLYGRPPSVLRRQRSATAARPGAGLTLTLGYAAPYDWGAMIAFLAARAIPGVEVVEPGRYRRSIALDGCHGTVDVAPVPGRSALAATIRFARVDALPTIVGRLRRLFDLDADVRTIAAQLSADPELAALVRARPGLRVPGAWDGFELAVRAVLGQQITVTAARGLAGRLVAAHGEPLDETLREPDGPSAVFPAAERLAGRDLATLGMPRTRLATLATLASTVAGAPRLLHPEHDPAVAVQRLRALPGIGEWTAQYIALRALRDPDAFPAGDLGLQRALARADGTRPDASALLARAEAWRPWRAYAAQHLWTAGVPHAHALPRPTRRAVA